MKKMKTTWVFLGGIVAGLVLTLCLGAADKPGAAPRDFSKLQWFTYPSGLTAVFDPATHKLYVYDNNIQHCTMIREMTAPGESMIREKF
jgi:hypothetical protein